MTHRYKESVVMGRRGDRRKALGLGNLPAEVRFGWVLKDEQYAAARWLEEGKNIPSMEGQPKLQGWGQ